MTRPVHRIGLAALLATGLLAATAGCSSGPDPQRFQHLWTGATAGLDRLPDDANSTPGSVEEATIRLALPSNLRVAAWDHQPGQPTSTLCLVDKAASTYLAASYAATPKAAPVTVMLGDGPCDYDPGHALVVSPDWRTFTKGADLMGDLSRQARAADALVSIGTEAKNLDTVITDARAHHGAYPADDEALAAALDSADQSLTGGIEVRDYRPDSTVGAFTFCLVDPGTGAWGLYDSEAAALTGSGSSGAHCTPTGTAPAAS